MKNRDAIIDDNWATPSSIYDPLNAEFNFDFDPCPYNVNPITPETDGLLIEWGNVNFVNPPYSRKLKEQFVLKAIEESKQGKICVLLLPVSTSTVLFHDLIKPNAKEIRFVRGRIVFLKRNAEGEFVKTGNCGMNDSMIVIFDKRTYDFL